MVASEAREKAVKHYEEQVVGVGAGGIGTRGNVNVCGGSRPRTCVSGRGRQQTAVRKVLTYVGWTSWGVGTRDNENVYGSSRLSTCGRGASANGGEKYFDICGRDEVGGVAEADKESKNDVGV